MVASTATESVFDAESFINEYYGAWSGTDEDRILSYYADNVVLQIPGTLMEGKEALRDQFVRPFITAFPGNRHLVKNTIFVPGVAIVEFDFQARHQGPFAGHEATGARVNVRCCGVYEYDSAKRQITAARIYFDVGMLLQTITDFPVNDRKNAAEALQLNERNRSLIIDTIPTAAWSTRADGFCDFLNQRWLDYAGMTAEQAAGWGWAEAIHPDDRKGLVEYWQGSLASGLPVETEARVRRFDGSYRWFLFRANPLRDESGKTVKWYGTNIDIEDRKRGEEALRASEFSWRQIVDNIPGFVATTTGMGEIEFLNHQLLEYFGRTSEELKNWALIDAVHPDDLPRVIEARKRSIEAGEIYDIEHRCRRADGVYRWFQVRGLPVRNAEGAISAWYLLLTDIEDRKKAEEELQASERNLRQITNVIPTNIHVLRPDGSVLYVNQPVLDYTGLTMADVLKEDYRARVFHPEDVESIREELRDSLTRPVLFENEQRALGKDGKYRWFWARYNPLLDEEGRIDRWYVASVDIEDRKRVEWLRAAETRTLQMITEGASLTDILNYVCASIDVQVAPWFTTILLMDPDGKRLWPGAGPKVPQDWASAITPLPVAEDTGLCGTAAFLKTRVIVPDVATESTWREEYRGPALKNGIRAGWSQPILTKDNQVLGTFAIYSAEPRLPTDEDLALIEAGARITLIAIERQHSQEALRNALDEIQRSESKLRQVIDAIPALAWCNLPDGPNEFLSKPWHEYTGLTPEESQGWGWQVAFHPDDLPPLMEKWTKMLTSGESEEIEARLRRHDGVYRWFLIRAEPFRDESGNIVRWYGTSTDIEDRKRAEEALQSNERNLSLIINTIPTHIYVLNTEGSVQYVSQAVMDYTGLSMEDVQQEDYRDRVIHPEDFKRVRAPRAAGLRRGAPFSTEQRVLGNDGQYRWFLVRYKPLLDEQGRIERWYATAFDIEDRKMAEAEIEQAYLRLAEAQRVSKTGSFITDLLLDEHNWSEELCRIFEIEPGTRITAELIRTLFHPEDLPVYEDAFRRAVDGQERDIDISYRIITPAGNVKHLHAVTHILEKIAGRPIYIGAIQDVTESKVAEQALTRARAELAHMARVTTLSALTASISHEVNQPIAAAVASAGACLRWLNRDQPDVQRAREAAMRIEHDGKRAAEIISHLKSFYKKDVSPQRETVSVNDLVEEMLVLLRSEAERHSVVMRTELPTDQLRVTADRVQLQQVLMNLMLNGMESMSEREGELKVRTRREGEEVIVSVSDTGEGIPADKMEEIFNAFVTTKAGGTGMGLAISSTIIESHSGRLWATANPERGATFHFSLRAQREAQSEH